MISSRDRQLYMLLFQAGQTLFPNFLSEGINGFKVVCVDDDDFKIAALFFDDVDQIRNWMSRRSHLSISVAIYFFYDAMKCENWMPCMYSYI